MTSLHVICGLGLPQSKILDMPMNWKLPEKSFWRLFFGEHLRLCPWPWPRAFLSLASKGSVLGKAVLGLRFFLCPWPWASFPRLRLWSLQLRCWDNKWYSNTSKWNSMRQQTCKFKIKIKIVWIGQEKLCSVAERLEAIKNMINRERRRLFQHYFNFDFVQLNVITNAKQKY